MLNKIPNWAKNLFIILTCMVGWEYVKANVIPQKPEPSPLQRHIIVSNEDFQDFLKTFKEFTDNVKSIKESSYQIRAMMEIHMENPNEPIKQVGGIYQKMNGHDRDRARRPE